MGNRQSRLPVLLSIVAIVAIVVAFGRRPTGTPAGLAGDSSRPLVLRRPVPLSVGQSQTTQVPFTSKPLVAIAAVDEDPVRPRALPAVRSPVQQRRHIVPTHSARTNQVDPSRAVPRPQAQLVNSPVPIQVESPLDDESASGPRYHRIVEGDTLDGLAATYFGNPDRFLEIFHANLGVLTRPDVLPLGVRIVIPPGTPIRTERTEPTERAEFGSPAIETPESPGQKNERPAAVGTSLRPMVRIAD